MNDFTHWYTGFIIAAILVKTTPLPCPVVNTSSGKLYANCFGKFLKAIPRNLGQNLKILNISKNPILTLSSEDMKPYPELIELNMKSLITVRISEFDPDLLLPLKKLEVLHISDTLVQLPPMPLPPSILELYANRVPRTLAFVNFSVLTKLTHLELDNCSLHGLPVLSPEAPLDTLHIQYNFLNKLRYTDLAPYCLLRELLLIESDLSSDHLFGHCCDILIWLEEHNVINTIECQIKSSPEPCDREKHIPDPKAILAHDQCLIRNGLLNKSHFWMIFFIFIFCLVILLAGFGGYKFYNYYKSKKSERELQKTE